jgi:2-(1,2-epoxy-1,2-dihydrophenyl)acetyl-CoA isomerase
VVNAEQALRIGLVTRVVPDADLPAAAAQLAGQLAALDPGAIAATKGLLNADPSSWCDVLEAERDTVVRGFSAPAVRERLEAFGRDR